MVSLEFYVTEFILVSNKEREECQVSTTHYLPPFHRGEVYQRVPRTKEERTRRKGFTTR